MSPNVTRKRGGPKKGQRCSNPKIPKVLAELGVQGFGCLEPSRSTPGTLQDAYDLDHTRPTSKKPTFSVNIPSQPHIAPRRRDNCKNKSRSAQRNAGRAPRNAARTSASRLKTSHPRVPDTEDDTKSFVPDIVGTQPHRLEVPAPTGDSTQHPAGHLSSQPETLQLAKSPSSQGQSHTVHHPPLFGTPSQAAAKTSSPPHAKKAQSVREPAPDMSMGSVAGGVGRNERTRLRSSHYAGLPNPQMSDTDRAFTGCLPPTAFHLPFTNLSPPLYDSAVLKPPEACDDCHRAHAANQCTAQEAALNAADNDHRRPAMQTSAFGDGALVINSLIPHSQSMIKSKLSIFSTLAQALGSSTTSHVRESEPISQRSRIEQSIVPSDRLQY